MATPVAELKPKPTSTTQKETLIRVLHVDDEPGLLKTTKQILEAIGSFQVETVLSVNEAIKKLEDEEFDVIISDYQMPGKNGLEFLRELHGEVGLGRRGGDIPSGGEHRECSRFKGRANGHHHRSIRPKKDSSFRASSGGHGPVTQY